MRYKADNITSRSRARVGIIKKASDTHTYYRMGISANGKKKFISVSRTVLLAFIGADKDPKRNQANHKNGIKSDNRLENLEWCTDAENKKHARDELGIRGNQVPWHLQEAQKCLAC